MLLQNNPNIQGADGSEYRLFTVALMLGKLFSFVFFHRCNKMRLVFFFWGKGKKEFFVYSQEERINKTRDIYQSFFFFF